MSTQAERWTEEEEVAGELSIDYATWCAEEEVCSSCERKIDEVGNCTPGCPESELT